jgi:hypothetical protein
MSNISNTYVLSAALIVAFGAARPHLAWAQDQATSHDCGQQQLADKGKKGEKTKSEVLAKCNSVIHPPQVGDQEMVEPAPSVGRTPVIKLEQKR